MKFKTTILIISVILGLNSPCAQKAADESVETNAIKQVLVDAYIKGIHVDRDIKLVKAGFHPDFAMHVLNDNQIIKASLDMWLQRLQLNGIKNENRINYEFKFIDVTNNSAIVKMEIYENSKHLYTDYFCLYKFDSGWKSVSKIFAAHE